VSAPDEWELVITSTSRIQLERALELLLRRDAALLCGVLDGLKAINEEETCPK